MSLARLSFFIVVCVMSCVWAALAFSVQYVRLGHEGIIRMIQAHKTVPEQAALDAAIADYESITRIVPCNVALYKDMGLLLAQRSDIAMHSTDVTDAADALEKMQNTLSSRLACTPRDGKAWLDFAAIATYQEGFSDRALAAYKMSQYVAPEESWLAQRRLLFALKFKPLFDVEALEDAQDDVVTLEHAHPNRMKAVLKAADVESEEVLYALFDSSAGK